METDKPYFEIKSDGDWIKVLTKGFSYPNSSDDYDSQWIKCYIDLKAGVFSANYKAEFMTVDFKQFKKGLEYLYEHLDRTAKFEGLEGYLKITLKGDGIGHMEVFCEASEQPGYHESTLSFYLDIDQTFIPQLIRQLDEIIDSFRKS
jgi:hypothetical protein